MIMKTNPSIALTSMFFLLTLVPLASPAADNPDSRDFKPTRDEMREKTDHRRPETLPVDPSPPDRSENQRPARRTLREDAPPPGPRADRMPAPDPRPDADVREPRRSRNDGFVDGHDRRDFTARRFSPLDRDEEFRPARPEQRDFDRSQSPRFARRFERAFEPSLPPRFGERFRSESRGERFDLPLPESRERGPRLYAFRDERPLPPRFRERFESRREFVPPDREPARQMNPSDRRRPRLTEPEFERSEGRGRFENNRSPRNDGPSSESPRRSPRPVPEEN